MNNEDKLKSHRESQRKWRLNNPDKVKAYRDKYNLENKHKNAEYQRKLRKRRKPTARSKELDRMYRKNSFQKNSHKDNARNKLYNALRNGSIIPLKYCEGCLREKKVEGHHPNYSKPLLVIWLCRQCHTIQRNIEFSENRLFNTSTKKGSQ